MSFAVLLLIIIFIMWQLLVKGWLWKITIGIFGWFGIYWALLHYIPSSRHECLNIAGCSMSWSAAIPSFILIMSMFYTKE